MIGFFNFAVFQDKMLLTNDAGQYIFLEKADFVQLLLDASKLGADMKKELSERYFLMPRPVTLPDDGLISMIQRQKSHLFQATSLHIFVVTTRCNTNCVYCQAKGKDGENCGDMTRETAQKAVDIALQSPARNLTFEFQGGEPLLNFDVIRFIVQYTEQHLEDRNIEFAVVSNLSLMTEEIALFFQEHHVSISTSLDGSKILHDQNRPMKDGRSGFDLVRKQIQFLKKQDVSVGCIETTTRFSFDYAEEIVDTYLDLGYDEIFIRPLTPLGFAHKDWAMIGYTPDQYIQFYDRCIRYMLELNKRGIFIREGHARIFLTRILYGEGLNYMELRSPCGASVGQMAYYYDGNIYTCDEGRMLAEMGDNTFRLGNVQTSSYQQLMDSSVCKSVSAATILETLPGCCDCVYQPYCGVCPVINYAESGDIFAKYPRNYRCQLYHGMLDVLFALLYQNDPEIIQILRSWCER